MYVVDGATSVQGVHVQISNSRTYLQGLMPKQHPVVTSPGTRLITALASAATIVPLLACVVTLYLYAYAENQTPLRTGLLITAALWTILGGGGAAFAGVDRANRSEFLALRGRVATLESDLADATQGSQESTGAVSSGGAAAEHPSPSQKEGDRWEIRSEGTGEPGSDVQTGASTRQSTQRHLEYLKDALGMSHGETGRP